MCDALTELVDIGAGVLKKRLKPNTSYVRKADDAGGHLIGSQFGGYSANANMVARC